MARDNKRYISSLFPAKKKEAKKKKLKPRAPGSMKTNCKSKILTTQNPAISNPNDSIGRLKSSIRTRCSNFYLFKDELLGSYPMRRRSTIVSHSSTAYNDSS